MRTGPALIYLFPDRLNKLFRGQPEERVAVSFSPNMLCPALSTDVWTPFRERIKRVALGTGQRVCEITKIGKLCVCWGSGSAVALAAEPAAVTWPPQTQGPVHSWLGGWGGNKNETEKAVLKSPALWENLQIWCSDILRGLWHELVGWTEKEKFLFYSYVALTFQNSSLYVSYRPALDLFC